MDSRYTPFPPKVAQNRESLLRVRRRQKLERVLQNFCFRDADVNLAERRWQASQFVIQDYDSGNEISDELLQNFEFEIRHLSGEFESAQTKRTETRESEPVSVTSRVSSHGPSISGTDFSSNGERKMVQRPRGEVDEWATLQVCQKSTL